MRLRIVADQVIAQAARAFGDLGEVRLVDGRAIDRALLEHCDVLLVRSVTPVDAALLSGTPLGFVGTATAGIDHVDTGYLRARGIRFAAAPGCNARPVGEYVLACVLAHAAASGRDPRELRCGVIGCGHAGNAALTLLEGLGLRCLRNDPPRAQGEEGFVSLQEALAADVVSLHVPLTATGPHATRGLLGAGALAALRPGTLLINAARGGVVDEAAWLDRIRCAGVVAAVDCWTGEPDVSPALLEAAFIASPHVAGHSVEARLRATLQLRAALLDWLATDRAAAPAWQPATEAAAPVLAVTATGTLDAVAAAVAACCDPRAMTVQMREALAAAATRPARHAAFDRLRAAFGRRREFGVRPVALAGGAPDTAHLLESLGFTLVTA